MGGNTPLLYFKRLIWISLFYFNITYSFYFCLGISGPDCSLPAFLSLNLSQVFMKVTNTVIQLFVYHTSHLSSFLLFDILTVRYLSNRRVNKCFQSCICVKMSFFRKHVARKNLSAHGESQTQISLNGSVVKKSFVETCLGLRWHRNR